MTSYSGRSSRKSSSERHLRNGNKTIEASCTSGFFAGLCIQTLSWNLPSSPAPEIVGIYAGGQSLVSPSQSNLALMIALKIKERDHVERDEKDPIGDSSSRKSKLVERDEKDPILDSLGRKSRYVKRDERDPSRYPSSRKSRCKEG